MIAGIEMDWALLVKFAINWFNWVEAVVSWETELTGVFWRLKTLVEISPSWLIQTSRSWAAWTFEGKILYIWVEENRNKKEEDKSWPSVPKIPKNAPRMKLIITKIHNKNQAIWLKNLVNLILHIPKRITPNRLRAPNPRTTPKKI